MKGIQLGNDSGFAGKKLKQLCNHPCRKQISRKNWRLKVRNQEIAAVGDIGDHEAIEL